MCWKCSRAAALLLVIGAIGERAWAAQLPQMPTSGPAVPEMAAFDRIVTELMRRHQVPGGALAVAKDGRLLLARGYGLADVENKRAVRPDDLFRIASISKPITAAAALVLVERGRLELDAKVAELLDTKLPDGRTPHGEIMDPRLRQVTVRQLLHHTGGFDRTKSFDPMLGPPQIVEALGSPADPAAIVRFMFARPLDFDPGARHAYSNFGYCLLGRVIERVTGRSYEGSVRRLVLRPAGIRRMRLGRTRAQHRAEAEVRYYPPPGAETVASVFPDVKQPVPSPYGRFYIEAMDAHGGWIASAVDLVRFAASVDGSRRPGLLQPETVKLIESRPAEPISQDEPAYYGLGWMIRPVGDKANWWHAGGLPGTRTLLVRTHHGLCWAAVLNSRPSPGRRLPGRLDRGLWQAAGEVKKWPRHDLFDRYK